MNNEKTVAPEGTCIVNGDFEVVRIETPDSVKAAMWLLEFLQQNRLSAGLTGREQAAYDDALICVSMFTKIVSVWRTGGSQC